jgi:hypothetical protein
MDKVATKQQRDGKKVKILTLQELRREVLNQTEGVCIHLNETEADVEPWVGLSERAALEVMDTKDWTSRVESDIAGLRTAMADGSVKVEEVQ